MKTNSLLKWTGLLPAVVALAFGFDPGRADAQPYGGPVTVPTCNGFDATGTIPMYFPPGSTTGVTLCTDYFGKGHFANSPLPAGPIDTSATGLTIANGGTGYTAPVVTVFDYFNSPGVVPATCSATVTAGTITRIACSSGGSGYTAPVVSITDPTGTDAWVFAKLSAAGPLVGGIHKFVDPLPDLKSAIATPDKTTYPGSDYYEIAVVQTQAKMHTDLPPTTVRGYVQLPRGSASCPTTPTYNYLGPVILAQKNVPVRVKFTNCLPTGAGGNLFIPADSTYMGAGIGPDGISPYLDSRATLHLHGGNTPWISDGTPHQWTVPVGEVATYARGVSTEMVPDMFFVNGVVVPRCSPTVTTGCSGGTPAQLPSGASNDPGQGSMTFYWTNQQGGRLMFYHDHAYGITRLNVYAGEAAGYLLYDPAEESALLNLGVPGTIATNAVQTAPDLAHLIPLVIQDKTFVPSASQLAGQDPTWIWGTPSVSGVNGNGDLWFPHVYLPNQNPSDPGGANAFGRWDYGAWFYPPQTSLTAAGSGVTGVPNSGVTIACTSAAFPGQILQPGPQNDYLAGCPITPNPSGTPEGFMDTPLVNGKAYPVLNLAPEAYRFQILSAGNDRSWNLQLYVADATGKDVAMLPAVPPSTGSVLPLCGTVNTLTQPGLGLGLPAGLLDASGNPLNGTGLPANCWPNYGAPSPGIHSKQFMWPGDGRDGGVPDPRSAGPAIIQIGTEGGLLPAPVVIPSTPTNFEVNTRSITITNVAAHGLWLGPAERADVIIDFTKFANQTLILYSDSPAPAPAFDMRTDYYTGDQDQTITGGAPTTLPGYGPNTRTIMQIVVNQAASGQPPFNVTTLKNGITTVTPPVPGLPGIFKATQPAVIVPEPSYPAASGANAPSASYARVQDTSITFQPAGLPVAGITVNAGGTGYSATPVVTIAPPGCPLPACIPAVAGTPTVVNGVITGVPLANIGQGYTTAPLVTIADSTGTGAGATASLVTRVVFDGKAIQELFTLDYGRMNATLGNELPLTNFLVQTTLPFGYSEWNTEILQADKPQIWYLTHNGVDTHFIHFHLFNVQVINRVGWDGSVRPPDQNELGWKDTVRMNPLENILVAPRPITPVVPFPIPDSIRLMDVTIPEGAVSPAMSGIDPATGNAIPGGLGTTNARINFGWEYVWHCHILGHEENDMMRPMIYQVAPPAPANLLAAAATVPGAALTWTDTSASETAFIVQRDTVATFNTPALTTFTVNANSANTAGFATPGSGQTVSFTDTTAAAGNTYLYRVQATDDFTPQSPLTAPFQTVPLFSAWSNTLTVKVLITPTITWNTPAAISYGTALSGTQLNATARYNGSTVAGTFAYTPAAGTVLTPGNRILSVLFTPANTALYSPASATVTLVVNPAPLSIRASSAAMTYGGTVPAITASFNGLVNGDTASTALSRQPVCSTTATSTSSASPPPYLSSCSGAVAPNYTITYLAGAVTVNRATSTTTLTAHAPNPSIAGNPVTVSFAVAPQISGTPTGSVTVNASSGQSCTGTLSAGTGNCNLNFSTGGARTLTATYAGNVNFAGGTSNPPVQQVVSAVTLSASTLSFGNQLVGTSSASQTITLSNVGTTALAMTGITMVGPNPGDFSQTNNCPIGRTLAAGRSCTITTVFGPTSAGTRTAVISITDVDPLSPQSVSLTGTAVAPVAVVSPNARNYSSPLNAASAPQSVTLSNTGTAPLGITSIALGGTDANQFAQSNNCGVNLASGSFCTINITFRPTTLGTGSKSALLNVTVAAPATSKSVTLTGTVIVPTFTLAPTALPFGNQAVRTTSAVRAVTVRNTGTLPVTISSVAPTGGNANQFAQTNNCGASLAAGSSCTINVTFRPTTRGAKSSSLNVNAAAPAASQSVVLTGKGL